MSKLKKNMMILFVLSSSISATPFTDNGDGTVTDQNTNLRWQKCSMGQTNDTTCSGTATTVTWQGALNYCNALTLAGKTWRLPNINELKSIADRARMNPSIDTTFFPSTIAHYYWSSSTYAIGLTNYAWIADFIYGGMPGNDKALSYYVRCVLTGP